MIRRRPCFEGGELAGDDQLTGSEAEMGEGEETGRWRTVGACRSTLGLAYCALLRRGRTPSQRWRVSVHVRLIETMETRSQNAREKRRRLVGCLLVPVEASSSAGEGPQQWPAGCSSTNGGGKLNYRQDKLTLRIGGSHSCVL